MPIEQTRTVVVLALVLGIAPAAGAQVLGTFSWQLQPYCNVVTLALTTTATGWTVDGTDDQCGASDKASAVGVAAVNGAGHVTLNFTIVTAPAGKPVHVSALVSTANGLGTWTDSVGNSGTFVLSAATPGLPPRPLPRSGLRAGSVTAVEFAEGAVGPSAIAPNAVTGIAVADGSLTTADLADAPRAAFVEVPALAALQVGAPTVLAAVTLTVPAPGRVIAHVSGELRASSAAADYARCSLTRTATEDGSFFNWVGDRAALASTLYFPLGMTRGFTVAPGPFTVRLICTAESGTVFVDDVSLTATFFPG